MRDVIHGYQGLYMHYIYRVMHGYGRVWIVINSVKLLQPKNYYVRSMVQCSMHVIKTKLCQK